MARRSRKSKNPRRRSRRGSNGWIKRHGKWVKGALARGGRKARSARRGRKSRSSKRTYRKSARRSRRGRHSYRRNPASSEFRDGTSISISGDTVTLLTPYGETYEYSDVDSRARARVMTCKSASQAKKILNAAGVLAAINPKRGRGRTSKDGKKQSRRYRGRFVRHIKRSRKTRSRRGKYRMNCGRY